MPGVPPRRASRTLDSAGDLYLILNATSVERAFAVPAAPHGGAYTA